MSGNSPPHTRLSTPSDRAQGGTFSRSPAARGEDPEICKGKGTVSCKLQGGGAGKAERFSHKLALAMSWNPTCRAKSGGPARQPEHSQDPAMSNGISKLKVNMLTLWCQFKSLN